MRKRSVAVGFAVAWRKLVEADSPAGLTTLRKAVMRTLSPPKIESLMRLYATGTERERLRAFGVLATLARNKDPRLDADRRARWTEAVRGCARKTCPKTLLGRVSFEHLLCDLDKSAAEAVLAGIDVRELTEEEREDLAHWLPQVQSDAAEKCLLEIHALGGKAGRYAQMVLEPRGALGTEGIERLAAEWRARRTPDLLHQLYLRWVAHQVDKASLKELIALLGRPDRREGRSVWYAPNEGTALYLEGDARGRLKATKFT